jgi:hypothetical protein
LASDGCFALLETSIFGRLDRGSHFAFFELLP